MTEAKPPCGDFIIAAVRRLRRNPTNIREGNAGVRVDRVWKVAKTLYSQDEFCTGLRKLLCDEKVLITAMHCKGAKYGQTVVTKVPETMPASLEHYWYLDENDNYLTESTQAKVTNVLTYVQVYVLADGLPLKAQKIVSSACKASVAREIIKSMGSSDE